MQFYRNESLAAGLYVFLRGGGWQSEKGQGGYSSEVKAIPLGGTIRGIS